MNATVAGNVTRTTNDAMPIGSTAENYRSASGGSYRGEGQESRYVELAFRVVCIIF